MHLRHEQWRGCFVSDGNGCSSHDIFPNFTFSSSEIITRDLPDKQNVERRTCLTLGSDHHVCTIQLPPILSPLPPLCSRFSATQIDTNPTTPSTKDGLKSRQCAFSCPLQDSEGHGLALKMDGLGYNEAYSIFKCMYMTSLPLLPWRADGANFVRYSAPNSLDQAKACWYYTVQSTMITPPFCFTRLSLRQQENRRYPPEPFRVPIMRRLVYHQTQPLIMTIRKPHHPIRSHHSRDLMIRDPRHLHGSKRAGICCTSKKMDPSCHNSCAVYSKWVKFTMIITRIPV